MTKEELQKKIVSAISLGCDKNRVDLEKMLGKLKNYGFQITEDLSQCDIVIVNTCAFITPAQMEAISSIIEMEEAKKQGRIEKIIVTGCFSERNYSSMKENFPIIDKFLKIRENENICNVIEDLYGVPQSKNVKSFDRILTNAPSYAYLKIADGCDNVCSFCTIPRIRGRYKSEPIDDLVAEAKKLVAGGVKELILVAQDTTRYGEDLYGKNCLKELCDKLSKIKDLVWIRVHYTYPEKVDEEFLDYIMKNSKMCKYLDIPLQHVDDEILKSMRRRTDEEKTRALVKLIKEKYPGIAIRTTFIVGYPSETRKQFKKLKDFIKETKFDYAGFFSYSREQNTVSYYMKKQVPEWIKKHRLKTITHIQQNIATENAHLLIGKTISVLVDEFDSHTGEYVGHGEKLSPLVDFGVRFVDNGSVKIADFVNVKICEFDGTNYIGEIV